MIHEKSQWTFFSNYTHVLVCIAEDPEVRTRDIASRVGVTERSAVRIINNLKAAEILVTTKNGRRNHYLMNVDCKLRHPIEAHRTVGALLAAILDKDTIESIRKRYAKGLDAIPVSRSH